MAKPDPQMLRYFERKFVASLSAPPPTGFIPAEEAQYIEFMLQAVMTDLSMLCFGDFDEDRAGNEEARAQAREKVQAVLSWAGDNSKNRKGQRGGGLYRVPAEYYAAMLAHDFDEAEARELARALARKHLPSARKHDPWRAIQAAYKRLAAT